MRAIDADAFKDYIRGACEDMKHLFKDNADFAKLITESFCKDIDEQPTIQPEPHWIPVTERLPEEDQPVLVTDGAVMWVCSLIRTDDGYKWENNMGYWHDFDEWKAWMPLPEPYKGVTE